MPVTGADRSLSDRYRAAAEKHIGRPAIASRTAIAPLGIKGTTTVISGFATIATAPAAGGGAQTKPG